jgi:lipopolysaccharide export system protein LptA
MWKFSNSLAWTTGLLLTAVCVAEGDLPADHGRTDITARRVTVRNQENKAIFEGNVTLKKGALVVHSDVMIVYLRPLGPRTDTDLSRKTRKGPEELPTIASRTVSRIEATGRVRIERGEGRAIGREAVYNEDERKIVLTGDPVAWQRGTCVSGKKIILFLDEDRTVVEGESRIMIEPENEGRGPTKCSK